MIDAGGRAECMGEYGTHLHSRVLEVTREETTYKRVLLYMPILSN
jgi:hypothetical protein